MKWMIYPDFDKPPRLFNTRPRSQAIRFCRDLLVKTRGLELPGLPNPLLIRELFREYSQPWAAIVRAHVETSWDTVRDFVYEALQNKANNSVANAYFNNKLGSMMAELLERANCSLDELTAVHKSHPFTVNSEYRRKIQVAEAKRLTKQMTPHIEAYTEQKGKPIEAAALKSFIMSTISSITEENMDLAAAEYALDAMLAYYEIALKTFVDNVPLLTISAKILQELPSLFRASDILHMDDELLNLIAGESEDLSERRTLLIDKLETLNEGAKICRRHESRTQPTSNRVLYSRALYQNPAFQSHLHSHFRRRFSLLS